MPGLSAEDSSGGGALIIFDTTHNTNRLNYYIGFWVAENEHGRDEVL